VEPLLDVRNLQTHFFSRAGVVRAVDGVSFRLDRGEILGLVGESGCGKSVSSLSLMRLVDRPGRIVAGEIVFEGRDLLALSKEEMRRLRGNRLAMIFQEPMSSMNPVFTTGSQIAEAILVHERVSRGEAKERTLRLMRLVGIPDPERRFRQFPHQFSGGMLQRMMAAMALACNPSLLIADEPVTALDVTIQAQILDLIKELRDRTGASILLITHDMGVVAETCDRVAVMYLGKIVEMGPLASIFAAPRHPYTVGLFASIPRLEETVEWLHPIPGTVPSPLNLPTGCRFATRCPQALPVCAGAEPPMREIAPGHQVACFLYDPGRQP
jgi:oligopeptide/dipeptide ABC transporter ATP-binding protein